MTRAIQMLLALAVAATVASSPERAAAQWSDEYDQDIASPEHFAWELRLGPYHPDVGSNAFSEVFGSDGGPLLAMELDYLITRIPYVGLVGVGASAGWSRYRGRSCSVGSDGSANCDDATSERAKFLLFPIALMGVLRVDVLARELGIPLLLAGKLGLDSVFFRSNTGGRTEAEGRSHGLRWGVELALELDFIEPRKARALDEDWGINHSFLFLEIYGSTASTSLPLGDTTFAAGLGLVF